MTVTLIADGADPLAPELTRRLEGLGHTVVVGLPAEDDARACVVLDTGSDLSAGDAAAAVQARFGVLDVLINNAPVASGRSSEIDAVDAASVVAVLDATAGRVVRMTYAFLPLLRRSSAPVIVNVARTSGPGTVGTLDVAVETGLATLRTVTATYAVCLPTMRINALDIGPFDRPTADGDPRVARILELATVTPEGITGTVGVLPRISG